MKLPSLIVAACIGLLAPMPAQEMPELPEPVKEHEWLAQLAGEWESTMECIMDPEKPPVTGKSTEK